MRGAWLSDADGLAASASDNDKLRRRLTEVENQCYHMFDFKCAPASAPVGEDAGDDAEGGAGEDAPSAEEAERLSFSGYPSHNTIPCPR